MSYNDRDFDYPKLDFSPNATHCDCPTLTTEKALYVPGREFDYTKDYDNYSERQNSKKGDIYPTAEELKANLQKNIIPIPEPPKTNLIVPFLFICVLCVILYRQGQ
jgi:hypothetical protein